MREKIEVKNIWIVEEDSLPSTEYYIIPAIQTLGLFDQAVILKRPPQTIPETGIFLIFVRYLSKIWIDFVENNRKQIKQIFYFMDDDLFDLRSWLGLPLRYIRKLFLKGYRWKRWFLKKGTIFLVSNNYLATKYHKLNPLIVPSYPIFDYQTLDTLSPSQKDLPSVIFYFGTSSHSHEKKWLYPVVREVLKKKKDIVFEIIAEGKIHRLYANLERTFSYPPMSWKDYKNFLLSKKRQVGLCPLLEFKFNKARNYTKFFEIAACGAVGIYSRGSFFDLIIKNNEEGLLLPNDHRLWIDILLELVENSSLRYKLLLNSLNAIKDLKKSAENAYKDSLGGLEWKKM